MKNTKNKPLPDEEIHDSLKKENVRGPLDDLAESNVDVTPEEIGLLQRSENSMGGEEDERLEKARLDNVDEDGDALNEENEFSGKDLDVPGAEEDDANEAIGEEDEENNSYSLGGDRNDD